MSEQLSLFPQFENLICKSKRRNNGDVWERSNGDLMTKVNNEIIKLKHYDLSNKEKFDEVLLKIKYDRFVANHENLSKEEFDKEAKEIEDLHEKIKSNKRQNVVIKMPKQKIDFKSEKIKYERGIKKLKEDNKDYILNLIKKVGIFTGDIYQFKKTFNDMLKYDLKVGLTIDDFKNWEIERYYNFLRRRAYGR
jgi:hypothetical protein